MLAVCSPLSAVLEVETEDVEGVSVAGLAGGVSAGGVKLEIAGGILDGVAVTVTVSWTVSVTVVGTHAVCTELDEAVISVGSAVLELLASVGGTGGGGTPCPDPPPRPEPEASPAGGAPPCPALPP